MESINFGNTYFSSKGMMPREGDTITLLWARKLVKNLANAYGIIGTVSFGNSPGYRSINLQLSRRYLFPPAVYLYYQNISPSNGICMPIETMPPIGEFDTIGDGKQYELYHRAARKNIFYVINGDALTIFNMDPNTDIVYYRVVGA